MTADVGAFQRNQESEWRDRERDLEEKGGTGGHRKGRAKETGRQESGARSEHRRVHCVRKDANQTGKGNQRRDAEEAAGDKVLP